MSRAGLVIPRLRTLWTEALAVSHPEVDVYLGPLVSGDSDDAVFVGYDGDPFGDMEVAVHTQQWAGAATHKRNDVFDVRCCVLNTAGAFDGDQVAAALERLYSVFMVCATTVHTDPSLGLGITPFVASITGFGSFLPLAENEAGGTLVEPRISYSVHVETRT